MNIKTPIFVFSITFNVIMIALFVFGALSKTSSLIFSNVNDNYVTTSIIVSTPGSGDIIFNAVELTLRKEEKAFIQFSVILNKKQANMMLQTLYDRQYISVEHTSSGLIITALNVGETVVQTLTNDGIKDLAFIKIED